MRKKKEILQKQSQKKTADASSAVQKLKRERARKQEELKKDNRLERDSSAIRVVGVLFSLVFVGMLGYLIWFSVVRGPEVVNNSYNVRIRDAEETVVRGSIYSSDGQILAQTTADENGSLHRVYPFGNVFSHAIGYSTVGITGVEQSENEYLQSTGQNFLEQIVQALSDEPRYGCNVITTIDASLQQTAYEALAATGKNGAVVAIEPSTGKILAMVSIPDFDPNTIASIWDDLISDTSGDSRLVNRASQGLYAPGSTFKVLTALEFLRENPEYAGEALYVCEGALEVGDTVIHCSDNTVHGEETLNQALQNSCNTFFAGIGEKLSVSAYSKLAESFLFNEKLGVRFEYKKSSFSLSEDSGTFLKMTTAFGQGETLVTPLHMAMIASAIANDGDMMTPYLVDYIQSHTDKIIKTYEPVKAATPLTADESELLTNLMQEVISGDSGNYVRSEAYTSAGKTGTAQYDSSENRNAWFMGFAPAEDPQIAVAVIVEDGGYGGAVAGPIARALYDEWILR